MFADRPLGPQPLALMRVAIVGHTTYTLWRRAPWREGSLSSIMSDIPVALWEPVGVWSLAARPPSEGVITALAMIALTCGVMATAGAYTRLVLPTFAIAFLCLSTLDQCWSRLEENRAFTCMVLLMLSVTRCSDAYAVHAPPHVEAHGRYRWPLHAIAVLWGSVLFVAAMSKLQTSGWSWVASDNLRHILLGNNVGMPGKEPGLAALWLVDHPVLCRVAAGVTLVSEMLVLPLVLTRHRRAIAFAGVLSAALLFGFWWLLRVPQTPHALGLLAFVDWDAVLRRVPLGKGPVEVTQSTLVVGEQHGPE